MLKGECDIVGSMVNPEDEVVSVEDPFGSDSLSLKEFEGIVERVGLGLVSA